MEVETEEFNWHLKWFLLYAKSFQDNQNKPNRCTIDLLAKALDIISNLTENYMFDDESDETEPIDNSFIDDEMFDSYRILFCRACKKSFTFNRHDYNSHINSGQHKIELVKSKGENLSVKVGVKRTIDDQAESVQRCHNVEEPLSPFSSYEMVEASSKHKTTSDTNKVDNSLASGGRKLSTSTQSLFDQRIFEFLGQLGDEAAAQSMNSLNHDSFSRSRRQSEVKLPNIGPSTNVGTIVRTASKFEPLKTFFGDNLTDLLLGANTKSNKIINNSWNFKIPVDAKCMLRNRNKFSSVECHLIGSRINGTTIDENSTLDIYLDLDHSFYKDKSGEIFVDDMNKALSLMKNTVKWSNVKLSEQSRYGKLYAKHVESNINCRFTFTTGVFVRNNDFIKCIFDVQPVCRQLILSIRLSMKRLNEPNWTQKFTGYIITLLVIFYFQSTKRLSSLKKMQEGCFQKNCGENKVSFDRPTGVVVCKERLSELLIGFFEFYSIFNYEENIISLFEGTAISHNVRNATDSSLPDSVLRFKRMINNYDRQQWAKSKMCIQDIFMHKYNVAQSIELPIIERFVEYCTGSLNILCSLGNSARY